MFSGKNSTFCCFIKTYNENTQYRWGVLERLYQYPKIASWKLTLSKFLYKSFHLWDS